MRANLLGLAALLLLTASLTGAEPRKPNIIFILVDDLGYGDLGAFFQNQRAAEHNPSQPWHLTPQLDHMAAEGIQLRHHYCPAPVCAPSRASLLSGRHQGHANVRDNQFDKALEDNVTLASMLKAAGYTTGAIGKYGLQGGPAEKSPESATAGPANWPAYPTKRGFDYYYGYVRHVDGHWHYPKEDGRQVWENDQEVSADLNGCYTTDLFTAKAKQWIAAQDTKRPFFLYLAYDTPHAKLQLPPGPFPEGAGAHGGIQWLGKPGAMINTANGTPDSYIHPDYREATWDHDHNPATPEQPWPDVYQRYATDVRRIDDCVGDLLALLKDLKIDQETLVVFTSDNGPSQESYLKEPYEADFFNSFGPFDGIKRDCWEGGIRVGALARWPGNVPPQRVSNSPSQSQDWMPTFAELAGVPIPARTDGVSLVPTLRGQGEQPPSRVYVEYFVKGKTPAYQAFLPAHRGRNRQQMQVLRLGDFVGVRYNILSHADPFEIYNVATDPQEQHDLGGETAFAKLQQEFHDTVLRVRRPDPTAPRPYDNEFVPAVPDRPLAPGLEWRAYQVSSPWLPKFETLNPSGQGFAPQVDLAQVSKAAESGLLFSGFIKVPADGDYTFKVKSDGRVLLRIHEAELFEFAHGEESDGASIRLQAGIHPFRLYYDHGPRTEPELRFVWHRGTEPDEVIPAPVFFHEEPAHP